VWGFSLAASAAFCLWAASAAGAATVLVGSPGGGFPGGGGFINFNPTPITVANLSLGEPGANVASPVNGTITRWRVTSGDTGAYTLHVLRPGSSNQFTEVGSSPGNVTVSGANTFSASLPIQAGDILGVDLPGMSSVVGSFGLSGSSETSFSPAFTSGSTASPDSTPDTGQETFLNADVEYTPSSGTPPASPPASPGPSAKKCKKKKKHKRSAESAKKKGCKKKKHG
jgi:hypothetical protein